MADFYRSESVNSSGPILSTGLPKKSKAQSKNVNKLKKFFYTTITSVLSGEYRSSASIALTISKLNQRKKKINENSEKAIDKVYDKYANKVANSPDSDISYLQQKRNESENEITDVRDSKLAHIDERIAHYQEILDKKSGVNQILAAEERKIGEEVSSIENNSQIINEPISNEDVINNVNQVEENQIPETSENIGIELEPISETMNNNQVIQPEVINSSLNEPIKPIEETSNISNEQNSSNQKHSEIKELEKKYLDDVASIRQKMNSEVASVISASLVELEKTYRNYYQNQIKMFSDKTTEVIEKANNEVIKEKKETLKITADRDEYKSHYEQAIATVKERDNTIASKDQEIADLKAALAQANNYVAESSKREETFKNELAASKNTIERYKQVVESFATVGTMQPPVNDEAKTK